MYKGMICIQASNVDLNIPIF